MPGKNDEIGLRLVSKNQESVYENKLASFDWDGIAPNLSSHYCLPA